MTLATDSPDNPVAARVRRMMGKPAGSAAAPKPPSTRSAGDLEDAEFPQTPDDGPLPVEGETSSPGEAARRKRPEPVTQPTLGDVLWLDDGTVVVYRQPIPNKKYDFIYRLLPGGAFEAQALITAHYRPRGLGRLELPLLREMIRQKRWERDAIVHALDHWSFGRFLPSSNGSHLDSAPEGKPAVAAGEDSEEDASEAPGAPSKPSMNDRAGRQGDRILRGARVVLRNGKHAWESVYWGRDDKGDVVAFQAGSQWQLTRLDLKGYGSAVEIGDLLPPEEVAAIADSLMAAQ